MAEIIDVPDIVLAPASVSVADKPDPKVIRSVDDAVQKALPVEMSVALSGLHEFLNEKHIAMLEQLLVKSDDARIAALHTVDSAAALVDFLGFSDMATLKHFLSLDDPAAREVYVQGLHPPAPVGEVPEQPSPVVIDHVPMPAIGAMMMDPGDGEDAGDGGGEADAGGGFGGDGIGPDLEVGDGEFGEGGEFGGESGGGDPVPGASEPEASTPSSQETPAPETPAGETTGEITPTDSGSGAGRQFDSSSPESNASSNTSGQTNSIRWEVDDPALSPPTHTIPVTTVSATTETGRYLTEMMLDYFEPPAVDMSAAVADAAMPSVGSFLRTLANGAAAIIVAGGFVAASFWAASYGRHSRSSRDGSHGGDPSHAVLDDSQAATDNASGNATDQAGGDDGLVFDAAAYIAQLRLSHADGAMDPRLDDPAFLVLLNQLGAQIIAEMPQDVISQNTPALNLAATAPTSAFIPVDAGTSVANLLPPTPNPALETIPENGNAPATPDPIPDPTPPAATLYAAFALAGTDASHVRGILDAAGNWVAQNAPGLLLHVLDFELAPVLAHAANAVLNITVNMEVRTGEAHAPGGHISMADLQEIIKDLHDYCESGHGAAAQGLHLAFMGLDVMSGEIVPDSVDAGASTENAGVALTGVPAAQVATL